MTDHDDIRRKAEEALARCDAATAPPWRVQYSVNVVADREGTWSGVTTSSGYSFEQRCANALLEANACTDLPWALNIVLALCRWVEDKKRALDDCDPLQHEEELDDIAALESALRGEGPDDD